MSSTFKKLADLYKDMEMAYSQTAKEAGLSCEDCPDNCCSSYFKHHTRVEWIYLLKSLRSLSDKKQKDIRERASAYLEVCRASLAAGKAPNTICPLNEDGLCIAYSHRLMICRMHGTKNIMQLPDGSNRDFKGCFRFVDITESLPEDKVPSLDRTPFYRRLAELEMGLLRKAGRPLDRVDITIAEMILTGPPELS